ncbi:MAG: HAD-IB family phosphatase [Bacteroidota bacterium]|mgnify:FL=1|nr:HAD-IB family phosphatase [Bacteroidota bacterium]
MKNYIFDFDSTFIKIESLDLLAKFSQLTDKISIDKIEKITKEGMDGKISFYDSLRKRIQLINSNRNDLIKTVDHLKNEVSDSFNSNKNFINKNAEFIYIVSSGFHEIIDPIVCNYGVKKENIYANNFIFNENDKIIGFDKLNPLSSTLGKVKIIKQLKLKGTVHVIGDGYTDYEIKKEGYADYFYLFVENIKRDSLVKNADYLLKSLHEFVDIIE